MKQKTQDDLKSAPEIRRKTGARAKKFDPQIGNSTRWQKGQSGNPGGRPRTKALTEAYRAVLSLRCPTDPQERTFAELIAWHLATAAAQGDLKAAIELADRTEGRAKDVPVFSGCEEQTENEDFSQLSDEELRQRIEDSTRRSEEAIAECNRILSGGCKCPECESVTAS